MAELRRRNETLHLTGQVFGATFSAKLLMASLVCHVLVTHRSKLWL
jgi:hypothetical protein